MAENIKNILKGFKTGELSMDKALDELKDLPYKDLGFAKVDCHRSMRRGFPEVIFGQGKTTEQIVEIAGKIMEHDGILLVTRTTREVFLTLKKIHPKINFDEKAGVIYYRKTPAELKTGTILIITAGTADLPAAEEARITAELMGNRVAMLFDVGVAGLHRILDKKDILENADVVVVIAGMEGALASVVSGLISKPVIAVPTSVGYGASFGGIAPLLTMMNSCSPGIAVVNIDNGFGAGYFASLING